MEDLQRALDKAKIALMSKPDSAFFTTVCFSLKHVWDNTIPTAATNGTTIKFNPDFFMDLNVEERVFLLLHESMHVAYLHMERVMERNRAKWNVAADHVINLLLIDRGFKMPKKGSANPDYKDLSTEEVYKLLPEQKESECDLDIEPGEGDPTELRQSVEDILVRAEIQSRMQNDKAGSIPGDIQIFLNGLLKPKLPWNRILQKFLYSTAKSDYSFRKPNRRHFPEYYLPSLHSESLVDLAIAVDISGSVSDEQFKRFISEIHSIFKMMKPEKISLIQFDTRIQSIDQIHNLHELSKVKFIGRGGTEIVPVIDWVNKNKPQVFLTFTDGEFRFKNAETKVQSIWLIHENPKFEAPFGRVIHYNIQ